MVVTHDRGGTLRLDEDGDLAIVELERGLTQEMRPLRHYTWRHRRGAANAAIGRALMSRPRLLLLDEPSSGRVPSLVVSVFETLERVNKEGKRLC
jgi:ABC-type branched-subunit amino acid transport system ATPase component